jgi:pantoate--beta-alanine ligase
MAPQPGRGSMMNVVERISEVRRHVQAARGRRERIGFVPTMGALHEGHLGLIRAAGADGGYLVVSIFVNPTQFDDRRDLEAYPRPLEEDLAVCQREGVDLLFAPTPDEMYPDGPKTTVRVPGMSETMCGAFRPGHFDGVCTVVAKLLAIVQPDVAYFGEKDAQQLAIVRRLAADLNLPVEIRGCPLIRDPDGLATSSRNVYLSDPQRRRALALNRALRRAEDAIAAGGRDARRLADDVRRQLAEAEGVETEYVQVVHPDTLDDLTVIDDSVLVAAAVRVGATRLIDNVLLRGLDRPGAGG